LHGDRGKYSDPGLEIYKAAGRQQDSFTVFGIAEKMAMVTREIAQSRFGKVIAMLRRASFEFIPGHGNGSLG